MKTRTLAIIALLLLSGCATFPESEPTIVTVDEQLIDNSATVAIETQLNKLPQFTPTLVDVTDVTGTWDIYYHKETRTYDSLVLTQQGNVLSGIWSGPAVRTPRKVSGSIDGAKVRIGVQLPGSFCRIVAKVSQEGKATMKGKWIVYKTVYQGTHHWRAEKR